MGRSRARLVSDEVLAGLRADYVTEWPATEVPDTRLVELLAEHTRLRRVLAAARYLLRRVEEGDEACVCGIEVREDGRHGRGCPVANLGRVVARAGT